MGRKKWLNSTRNYAAAENFARYGDFQASAGSADYELRNSLAKLREKARSLARNSPGMVRYIQLMRVNVIGERGFRLLSAIPNRPKLDERLQVAWKKWKPTVDGKMTLCDLQEQMVASWCRDGEWFWEIVYNSKYPGGVAINPLESDMIDETINEEYPPTGNEVRMGVEIDQYGAPVAYHVLTTHPGDLTWFSYSPEKRHRRVPADRIIHGFIRSRPGQTRGEPPVASLINSVKMLDGYREAEVMNRRIAASMMGFFVRDMPRPEGVSEIADRVDKKDDLYEMDVEPGRFKELPIGMKMEKFDPGGSQTDYRDFEGQVKKDQAMGFGISAFSHGMETEGVSYSTGRSVLVEDRDFYRMMQRFFIEHGMSPLFSVWVSRGMLYGTAPLPPTVAVNVMDHVKFLGRGWDWVDPAKDIAANIEALRTGQTSLTRVVAQRGIDIGELFAEIAEEKRLAESFGLILNYQGDIGGNDDTVGEDETDDDN